MSIRIVLLAAVVTVVIPAAAVSDNLKSITVNASPRAPATADTTADTAAVRPASSGVRVAATPDSATVGDSIGFAVSAVVPKNTQVIQPETDRGFGDFVVMSSHGVTRAGRDDDTVIYRYHLTTFKPDSKAIPQLMFLTKAEGDTLIDTLWTPPVPVRVASVIPDGTPESALVIRDLKRQQKAGRMGLGSLWLLLLAAVTAIVYYILEKRAKGYVTSTIPTVPLKPPYEEALELLAELEAKKLPERGEAREHVFELSEIFKRYIGRRFDTIAPELTTEEIVAWLEFSGLSREMRMCAEWFFRESDQVKYAKQTPASQILNKFMSEVRTFLEATKPETELPYEKKTQKMEAAES